MGYRVIPGLHRQIAKFGGGDVTSCMNCGNCTVTCSQSMDSGGFPRRIIHLLQVGHREKLEESLEPWLCYYCGECSDTCPREANPGEIMMAARRYLTTRYDWTGLGRRFYTSASWEITAVFLVGLFVVALFSLFHGPVVTDRVALNTFAPVEWVEIGDWIVGGTLGLILLTNASRMFRFVMRPEKGRKIPLSLLVGELRTFAANLALQKKWRECEGSRTRWLKHLLLVSGYATMIVLVEIFLRHFQTDEIHPVYHPTRLFGYYATAVLLYVTADFLIERVRRRSPIHKFTAASDWIFLILLFLAALTGILVHGFRLAGLPLATYATYVIHLAVVASFLIVQVPYGKWAHMLYRPLAVYLAAVKQKARESADRMEEAA